MNSSIITDPQVCRAYAADASGMSNTPEGVVRPDSEAEIVDLVHYCGDHGLAITPQGLRSSTTGSSVAERGVALSLERMDRVLDIDPERRIAVVEPGIILGEFKRQLTEARLFYPPDPTSENECTVGGTVATNASGSRTYRYGSTRGYVRSLRIVTAAGERLTVNRVDADKNASGYFCFQNPIDLWVGSEGTLGVITRIEVKLLPGPVRYFAGMAFFSSVEAALDFVLDADAARVERRAEPRCLELFDGGCLDLVRPEASSLRVPQDARAAIYFEEELRGDARAADRLEAWSELIDGAGGLLDDTIIAESEAAHLELRRLRHAIPAKMNDRGGEAVRRGGRKVSTDFAVPLRSLQVMVREGYRIAGDRFGGFTVAYGHVGNGHPHFNLLAEDGAQLSRAESAALAMARTAMALGGTLSAEHGIGKLKRAAYRELFPEWIHGGTRAVKASLDPKGLFAPGNLFEA